MVYVTTTFATPRIDESTREPGCCSWQPRNGGTNFIYVVMRLVLGNFTRDFTVDFWVLRDHS